MPDVNNLIGQTVAGWSLTKVLGNGADGIVYAARKDDREAAVKLIFPEALERNGREQAMQRLELQLSLRGSKECHNLVEVYEGGEARDFGTLYLAMELVAGTSLDKLVLTLPRSAIPSLLQQLVSAVRFLESRDLAHRDIKPANIMVSDDFRTLTLLDLGVISSMPVDDSDRLSGDEFVATLRYSPPEFVWRQEEESSEAWRSISFYQIGATLHDLIMRKRLFEGLDKPRAALYDAVKLHSPEVVADDCDKWLIHLAKCCLIKDWRERAKLVSWKSFTEPSPESDGLALQMQTIRLRQVRLDEGKSAKAVQKNAAPQSARIQELWTLQSKVFVEVRQFLMAANVFPRFSCTNAPVNESKYHLEYKFEDDVDLAFQQKITAGITFSPDSSFEAATEMLVVVRIEGGQILFEGKWTEMLTVESASKFIQQALLQAAEKVVPKVELDERISNE